VYRPTTNVSLFNLLETLDTTYPREMGMTMVLGYNHTSNSVSSSQLYMVASQLTR
jgi:hypothetical protein